MTREEIEKAGLELQQAGLVVSEGLDYKKRILGGSKLTPLGEGDDVLKIYSRPFFIKFQDNTYIITYDGPGIYPISEQANTLNEAVELIIKIYKERGWLEI